MPIHVFVAYPYALPKDDYRGAFEEAAREFEVEFDFADELLTNRHVLDKIVALIEGARFSLFDITLWNPNVTLELGVAIGSSRQYFLLFDRSRKRSGVPSDLAGLDRVEYASYTQLRNRLFELLSQQGIPRRAMSNHEYNRNALQSDLERGIVEHVTRVPGLSAHLVAKHFPQVTPQYVRQVLDEAVSAGLLGGSNVRGYHPARRLPPWAAQ